MSSSVTDLRSLRDDDYEALLNAAVQPNYPGRQRNASANNSDTGQSANLGGLSNCALSSTGLSKDAQDIFAVLREEAERDKHCKDEAVGE